jgi:hypothetical protein
MADVGEGPLTTPRADEWAPWDATSGSGTDAASDRWRKLPGGAVDPDTGALTGDDFPSDGRWQQC